MSGLAQRSLLLLFLLSPFLHGKELSAQWQWTEQTNGYNGILYGVHFVDANTGWTVGANGTILYTTDGGSSWNMQSSPLSHSLNDVFFIDANTGWAVGDSGTVIATTDGGSTWTDRSINTDQHMNGLEFRDASTGWVVGDNGRIFKTADGGNSWSQQSTPSNDYIYGIDMISNSEGFTSALFGTVFHTSDGGSNWNWADPISISEPFRDIAFFGPDTGLVVGDQGVVATTVDGGNNWVDRSLNTDSSLSGLSMIDSETGWAVGESGVTYYTTDGGHNWTKDFSSTQSSWYHDVHAVDASNVWAVGNGGVVIYLQGSTGLPDQEEKGSVVTVRPNPASEMFTVELTNDERMKSFALYATDGKKVSKTKSGTELRFDVKELKEGVYFLRSMKAEGKPGRSVRKVILE